MSGYKSISKQSRDQEASFIEADILSNLRLSIEFADLADRHAQIMDEAGFKYSCDQFLSHARLVSEKLKKLRSLT